MIVKWFERILDETDLVLAVALSMIMAYLRIITYEPETSTKRIAADISTSAILTIGAIFLLTALEMDLKFSVFIGVCIGYIGPVSLRLIAMKYIDKRM